MTSRAKKINVAKAKLVAAEEALKNTIERQTKLDKEWVLDSLDTGLVDAITDGYLAAHRTLLASVKDSRRQLFALEHPERVIRWEEDKPILSEDDEVFLMLKYRQYEER